MVGGCDSNKSEKNRFLGSKTPSKKSIVGRRQAVSHRFLVPACGGSNPPAPVHPAFHSISCMLLNPRELAHPEEVRFFMLVGS